MPLVHSSTFSTGRLLSNAHVQTVLGAVSLLPAVPPYQRERLVTSDGELLCLDWLRAHNRSVAVVCHGLEGSSHSSYMRSMCSALHQAGWDVIGCNMRGSGGATSRTPTFTHAGASQDVRTIVESIPAQYKHIALVGFSLGGNIVLKYLGEEGQALPHRVTAACVFSVPCDLASTAYKLANPRFFPYMFQFILSLKKRIDHLSKSFPDVVRPFSLREVKTFQHFDGAYTAPLHGFQDVFQYWERSSAARVLQNITVPTLLVNAKDDPFLDNPSFPIYQAAKSKCLYLEVPETGGHLGFLKYPFQVRRWVNTRAISFFHSVSSGDAA